MNVWIRRVVSATVMSAAMLLGGAGSAYADCDFIAPGDLAIGDTYVVNVVQVLQQDHDTTLNVFDRADDDDYDGDDYDVRYDSDRYDHDDDDMDVDDHDDD